MVVRQVTQIGGIVCACISPAIVAHCNDDTGDASIVIADYASPCMDRLLWARTTLTMAARTARRKPYSALHDYESLPPGK